MIRNCTGRAPMHARKLYEGISYCDEWADYENFEKWAFDHGWQKGMVLTRRDKKCDFTPDNCFFATRAVANGWRSIVHRLPDGRTISDLLGEQCLDKESRIRHTKASRRIFQSGWDLHSAVKLSTAKGIFYLRQAADGHLQPRKSERLFSRKSRNVPEALASWISIHRLCKGQGDKRGRKYYAGIAVCPEWSDFKVFQKWAMENGWRKGLRVVRRDKTKGFSPDNCFLAMQAEANKYARH